MRLAEARRARLHHRGYAAHGSFLRPGGLLIYDEGIIVSDKTDARRVPLPILERGRGSNIALLGIVCGLTAAVKPDSIRSVLERRYGSKSDNCQAFDIGLDLAEQPELSSFRTEAVK